MPEKFEEFIKENAPGPDGERKEKKKVEEDPGFFRKYVRTRAPPTPPPLLRALRCPPRRVG